MVHIKEVPGRLKEHQREHGPLARLGFNEKEFTARLGEIEEKERARAELVARAMRVEEKEKGITEHSPKSIADLFTTQALIDAGLLDYRRKNVVNGHIKPLVQAGILKRTEPQTVHPHRSREPGFTRGVGLSGFGLPTRKPGKISFSPEVLADTGKK